VGVRCHQISDWRKVVFSYAATMGVRDDTAGEFRSHRVVVSFQEPFNLSFSLKRVSHTFVGFDFLPLVLYGLL
jgi:hypothetical protein